MPYANVPQDLASPGRTLTRLWRRLAPLPGGSWLFSRALGFMVPYTGTVGARVVFFEPGRVVVRLRDRRRVRNHLGSVHAMALANLGELATGLAVLGALPPDTRGILTGFQMEYLKKARGTLEAECAVPSPPDTAGETLARAQIRDAAGDIVARAEARWLLGPIPAARTGALDSVAAGGGHHDGPAAEAHR